MKNIIPFLCGCLAWQFVWWLAGADFPNERGAKAIFYTFEAVACGFVGVFVARAIGEIIKLK